MRFQPRMTPAIEAYLLELAPEPIWASEIARRVEARFGETFHANTISAFYLGRGIPRPKGPPAGTKYPEAVREMALAYARSTKSSRDISKEVLERTGTLVPEGTIRFWLRGTARTPEDRRVRHSLAVREMALALGATTMSRKAIVAAIREAHGVEVPLDYLSGTWTDAGLRRDVIVRWQEHPEYDAFIAEHFHLVTVKELAVQFDARFGTRTTATHMVHRLHKLGLDREHGRGVLCTMDAAAELGITRDYLHRLGKAEGWLVGTGARRYLELDRMPALRLRFPLPPERTYTLVETRKKLGLSHASLLGRCYRGSLKAYRHGKNWLVSAAVVDEEARLREKVRLEGGLPTAAVAAELGLSWPAVLKLVKDGDLRARKVGRGYQVARRELDRFKTARSPGR